MLRDIQKTVARETSGCLARCRLQDRSSTIGRSHAQEKSLATRVLPGLQADESNISLGLASVTYRSEAVGEHRQEFETIVISCNAFQRLKLSCLFFGHDTYDNE